MKDLIVWLIILIVILNMGIWTLGICALIKYLFGE